MELRRLWLNRNLHLLLLMHILFTMLALGFFCILCYICRDRGIFACIHFFAILRQSYTYVRATHSIWLISLLLQYLSPLVRGVETPFLVNLNNFSFSAFVSDYVILQYQYVSRGIICQATCSLRKGASNYVSAGYTKAIAFYDIPSLNTSPCRLGQVQTLHLIIQIDLISAKPRLIFFHRLHFFLFPQ